MLYLPIISILNCRLDILFALLIPLIKQILSTSYSSNTKKVIKSILITKLYAMIYRFNIEAVFKLTTEKIFGTKLLSIIVYTDYKLLYNWFVKLGNIQEKELMVDLIYL